jgi:GNAT superfamily N-acetyltransferase
VSEAGSHAATPDVSVRRATPVDTPAVARVQVDTWRACYAPRLPPGALDALEVTAVEAGWRAAVVAPPTAAHQLLVALAGGRLVGYAAFGPSEDGDASAADGELLALTVSPPEQRLGHGSRLLSAAIDAMRGAGVEVVRMWTFDGDTPLHAFLGAAGWAPDGATRVLDMGEPVGQQRWHTRLRDI